MDFIHQVVGVCVQSFGIFKLKSEFIALKKKLITLKQKEKKLEKLIME